MVSGYDTGVNRTSTTSSTYSEPKFDQIIKGNVKICKTGDGLYRITFLKATEFTLYQVWNKDGDNGRRVIVNDTDKKWQERLIAQAKATGFAPTTIMEVGNSKWAFVITNAYFEKSRLVLEVSTAEIVNLSKTVQKQNGTFCFSTSRKCSHFLAVQKGLKTGYFKNARFDIDGLQISQCILCQYTSKEDCENNNILGIPNPTCTQDGCQSGKWRIINSFCTNN